LQPAKRQDLERLDSEEGLNLDISDTLDMFVEQPLPIKTAPVCLEKQRSKALFSSPPNARQYLFLKQFFAFTFAPFVCILLL
jgi:hypothetical protein